MSTDDPASDDVTEEPPPGRWGGPQARWPVFMASAVGVTGMALWAIIAPEQAESAIFNVVEKVTTGFGWFYILLATVILVFVLFLGFSRYGPSVSGPDHSRPEFSTFAWASMLFAAGIGTDLMFFSVVEPVTPVPGPADRRRRDRRRRPRGHCVDAVPLRHHRVGPVCPDGPGPGLLRLPARTCRWRVRSALYPIFGKRIDGPIGHAVDTAAVLGTIFGVATSPGHRRGLASTYGLNVIFGIPKDLGVQIALIVLAVADGHGLRGHRRRQGHPPHVPAQRDPRRRAGGLRPHHRQDERSCSTRIVHERRRLHPAASRRHDHGDLRLRPTPTTG